MRYFKWVGFTLAIGLLLISDPAHLPGQFRSRDGGGGGPGGFTPMGGGGGPGGFTPMGGGSGPGFGRGPGGGGFKMDPEMVWGMMQKSMAGPSPDTIDLSKMDPRMRDFAKRRAESEGTMPLPESGIMTKAQFLDHYARNEAIKASRAGGAPGGPPGFGPPGAAPTVVTLAPSGPMPGGPMPLSGPGGPPSFGGPPGGEDRGAQRLKEQDKDGDGRVTFAEADDRLKPNFQLIDRNGDGAIDLDEYRAYYAARDQNRGDRNDRGNNSGGPPPWSGAWGDPNSNWGGRDRQDPRKDTEEAKPVAMRYGKLPKDLPEWYDQYDADKDGQVALHEWRKSGKSIEDFMDMDLNKDGLITADELLRFNRLKVENEKIAALTGEGGGTGGSRPTFTASGMGGRGPSSGGFSLPGSPPSTGGDRMSATGDKGDKSNKWGGSDKGGEKPNPFRDGGFKKKG
jgi:Ca2+-binding EF-hand superfamily protein